MKTATYDNPATCQREFWRDQKITAFISDLAMEQLPPGYTSRIAWKTNQLLGDVDALDTDTQILFHETIIKQLKEKKHDYATP